MDAYTKPAAIYNQLFPFVISRKKFLLAVECAFLFFITPFFVYWFRDLLAYKLMPVLILLTSGCVAYLLCDETFDRRMLFQTRNLARDTRRIMVSFAIMAPVAVFMTYLLMNDRFLVFPIPGAWTRVVFILFYPLLLAAPQEIVFRTFFFHRYRELFPGAGWLILANGLSFGLAHIWYANMIAPALTAIGGVLFAWRYHKTQSLISVSIEHSLWGVFLYFTGSGWYFYSGCITS